MFDGAQSQSKAFIQEFELYTHVNEDHHSIQQPYQRIFLTLSYMKGPKIDDWVSVMTVRPELLFFFSFPSPPSPYHGPLPYLADCAPSLLSITCFTLALTVLHTRASVPADVHPLCTVHACVSSPLPYVSLHPLCTPPYPPNMCSTMPLVHVLVV